MLKEFVNERKCRKMPSTFLRYLKKKMCILCVNLSLGIRRFNFFYAANLYGAKLYHYNKFHLSTFDDISLRKESES